MIQSDIDSFATIWTASCEIYGKQPSDGAITMAFNALMRFDLADIGRALNAHINNPADGRFMPKPADVVRHIEGDPDSRALQAWSKVERAIERTGPYQSIVFDELIIMCCISDMGGWMDLCNVTIDELPFKRNEFTKRYRGYLSTPPDSHPSKLIGITEAGNSTTGHDIPEPLLIGNTQQALSVHRSGAKQSTGAVSLSQALKALGDRVSANLPKPTSDK